MRMRMLLTFAAFVAAAMLIIPSGANSTPAPNPDRDAIRQIVRDYLLEHPEIIEEAIQILYQRREIEQRERIKATILRYSDDLLAHPLSPVSGNLDGDITVVEFFDYQCPHCKRSLRPVMELLAADNLVRVVWKEFPILGPASRFAARAAMAADRQHLYHAFHVAVMSADQELTEFRVIEIAAAIGLNVEQLRRDMEDPAIDDYLDETARLARALGIGGTPAFVIGHTLVPGAVDTAGLHAVVAEARAGR